MCYFRLALKNPNLAKQEGVYVLLTQYMSEPKSVAYFAVDIEASGQEIGYKHGIVAAGLCIAVGGTVVEKRRWHVALEPNQSFEPRCLQSFWNTPENEGLLASLSTNQVTAQAFAKDFRAFIDLYAEKYDVCFVTDNAQFDLGALNNYMYLFGLPGIRYDSKNISYEQGVVDVSCFKKGLLGKNSRSFKVDVSDLKPHDPLHDAIGIMRMFLALVEEQKGRQSD